MKEKINLPVILSPNYMPSEIKGKNRFEKDKMKKE